MSLQQFLGGDGGETWFLPGAPNVLRTTDLSVDRLKAVLKGPGMAQRDGHLPGMQLMRVQSQASHLVPSACQE